MTVNKLDLLREALPYIRRFKGETFVLKLSGKVTGDSGALEALAEEVALCHQVGFRLVIVHGGGIQVSELASRLGIRQTIVNGRRVTDSATLEVVKMALAGKVNTDLLSVLRRHGLPVTGMSGLDGGLVLARRRGAQTVFDSMTGETTEVDFGHVGDIFDVDTSLLNLLLENGYVPVISCLGADEDGNVFNINADSVAGEVAAGMNACKLILLSDVDGVRLDPADPGTVVSRMDPDRVDALIREGIVTAGMVPKLQALAGLLGRGVGSAHIVNGLRRNALLQELFTDDGVGTMLVPDGPLASASPGSTSAGSISM